jgi:stage II sporulation protein AA (anti-sigma F factor antagonist)
MAVHREMQGDLLLLRVVGRLDSNSSPELEKTLLEGIAGARGTIIDFSDLEYISSAGLRIVLMGAKRAKQGGTRLALYGLRDSIREVFKVSGFLKILDVFDTREEARSFVKG